MQDHVHENCEIDKRNINLNDNTTVVCESKVCTFGYIAFFSMVLKHEYARYNLKLRFYIQNCATCLMRTRQLRLKLMNFWNYGQWYFDETHKLWNLYDDDAFSMRDAEVCFFTDAGLWKKHYKAQCYFFCKYRLKCTMTAI